MPLPEQMTLSPPTRDSLSEVQRGDDNSPQECLGWDEHESGVAPVDEPDLVPHHDHG